MTSSDIVDMVCGLYALSCALGLGCFLMYFLSKATKKEEELKERFIKAIEKVSEKYDK